MKKGLNFRTLDSQKEYFNSYEYSLRLILCPITEKYISTSFGDSHVICSGDIKNPPIVLLLQQVVVHLSGTRIYHFGVKITEFMP